jgi:hypothetical protein
MHERPSCRNDRDLGDRDAGKQRYFEEDAAAADGICASSGAS